MEQPRTTLASAAGLRNGYGTGICTRLDLPYHVLGHDGGIDGFLSTYGYSPSRDVGYVVLLNSTGGALGRGTDAPVVAGDSLPQTRVSSRRRNRRLASMPRRSIGYAGYYHDANPRNQIVWPLQIAAGRAHDRRATATAVLAAGLRARESHADSRHRDVVPRSKNELDASRVFTTTTTAPWCSPAATSTPSDARAGGSRCVRVPTLVSCCWRRLPRIARGSSGSFAFAARARAGSGRSRWRCSLCRSCCSVSRRSLSPARRRARWGTRNARDATRVPVVARRSRVSPRSWPARCQRTRARQASRWLTSYALADRRGDDRGSAFIWASHGLLGLRLVELLRRDSPICPRWVEARGMLPSGRGSDRRAPPPRPADGGVGAVGAARGGVQLGLPRRAGSCTATRAARVQHRRASGSRTRSSPRSCRVGSVSSPRCSISRRRTPRVAPAPRPRPLLEENEYPESSTTCRRFCAANCATHAATRRSPARSPTTVRCRSATRAGRPRRTGTSASTRWRRTAGAGWRRSRMRLSDPTLRAAGKDGGVGIASSRIPPRSRSRASSASRPVDRLIVAYPDEGTWDRVHSLQGPDRIGCSGRRCILPGCVARRYITGYACSSRLAGRRRRPRRQPYFDQDPKLFVLRPPRI